MSTYIPALGVCFKCGQAKIQAGDETKCIRCDVGTPEPSGLVVTIEDPGEEKLNAALASAGVVLPKVTNKANPVKNVVPNKPVVSNATYSFEDLVGSALAIMKGLPMPDDVKQFKKVKKVINDLEALLPEKK